jgi:hydrogenase nickel incorporation protein HypA/HybF
MHELSLCSSIASIVEEARDGRRVRTVHLQVGQLRQVVPDTLVFCWQLVTEDSGLAGSVLEIDHLPVVLDCRACAETTTVADALLLTCAACGSGDIVVSSGEELMVTALDLDPQAANDAREGSNDG